MNTPTKHPEIGFVFRSGGLGECTVTKVWESRFGDWKVSYADSLGGGGIMNLKYFTDRFGEVKTERRQPNDGACEYCGARRLDSGCYTSEPCIECYDFAPRDRTIIPHNAIAQATTPAPTNDDYGNKQ